MDGIVSASNGPSSSMAVHGGARNNRTITGALVGASNINADMSKVRDQDTPYTARAAHRDLVEQACHKVLGDKAYIVLNDTTNHGKALGEHAICVFVLSQEPSVNQTPKFEKLHSRLHDAVRAFDSGGEDGYSSTCNVANSRAYEVNRSLKKAITDVIKDAPGVYDTAAGMMHKMYLSEGLPKAVEARLGIELTPESSAEISLNGFGTSAARAGLQHQLNSARDRQDESSLTDFIGEMLNELDLSIDPVVSRTSARSARPHLMTAPAPAPARAAETGGTGGTGGTANIGDIVISPNINVNMNGITDLLKEALQQARNPSTQPSVLDGTIAVNETPAGGRLAGEVRPEYAQKEADIRPVSVLEGEQSPSDINYSSGKLIEDRVDGFQTYTGLNSIKPVDNVLPRFSLMNGSELFDDAQYSNGKLSREGFPILPVYDQGNSTHNAGWNLDDGRSAEGLNSTPNNRGGEDGLSSTRSSVGHQNIDGVDGKYFDPPLQREAATDQLMSVNFRDQPKASSDLWSLETSTLQARRSKSGLTLKIPKSTAELRTDSDIVRANSVLGSEDVGRSRSYLKTTTPKGASGEVVSLSSSADSVSGAFEPRNVIFEFNLGNMPKKTPHFVEASLNSPSGSNRYSGYFSDIASGIQSMHSGAQKLKSYIKDGKDPSQIDAATQSKDDLEVKQLFDMATVQNPNFSANVKKLFQEHRKNTQYTGSFIKTSNVFSQNRIVLSPGSSSAIDGFNRFDK